MSAAKVKVMSVLGLFGSASTLVCCALPAALAAIAGGAAVGSLISAFPWVITFSRYKAWAFLIAGLLIALNGLLTVRPHGVLACAITGGTGCETASAFGKIMLWMSLTLYGVGGFMAYGIVPLLEWLEG